MQEPRRRRSNEDRARTTRAALIAAARALFVEKSYAGTGTPDLVAAAGLTRGALYHHFADKKDLFRAVVDAEAAEVAAQIDKASPPDLPPLKALIAGGDAFIAAMSVTGRTRLLLIDGPAVLGRQDMDAIDDRHAARTLRQGLAAAIEARAIRSLPLEPLTRSLSAVFDRAALAIEAGASPDDWRTTIGALIEGLAPRV